MILEGLAPPGRRRRRDPARDRRRDPVQKGIKTAVPREAVFKVENGNGPYHFEDGLPGDRSLDHGNQWKSIASCSAIESMDFH